MKGKIMFKNMTRNKWIIFSLWMVFLVFMVLIIILASIKNFDAAESLKTTNAKYVAIVALFFFISLCAAIFGTVILSILDKKAVTKKAQQKQGGK
ncbi:hypothetical membrane spanning protein [Mycoplasmopsis fermentans JER]|nr:hypothetical membrane spanning protein [Mycoplasmopsis fermentans JER]